MLQHALRVLSTFAIVSAGGALVASDFDVVINEIHYNPASEVGDDEFLELYNRGGTEVDLSGWALSEGVSYVFPFGTTIPPKGYLVVSPNAVHSEARYRLDNVVGDWTGRLDNGGEIVALVSTAGDIISRVHYGDGGIWPSSPDGLGPSLEYGDPFGQIDVARHWHASARVDGSPGERNSGVSRTAVPTDEVVLIEEGARWHYRKGTSPYPAGWREPGYDDGAWLSGPTGIGYDDDDDATVLDDMQDGYVSFAARYELDLSADELEALGTVLLMIDYDDAFVAWLNGVEIARGNIGAAGEVPAHDDEADDSHEAGTSQEFAVPVGLFQIGGNALTVQIHNAGIGSSDASFLPRLLSTPTSVDNVPRDDRAAVVINELAPTEGEAVGFIELYNRSASAVDLEGWTIGTTAGDVFALAADTSLDSGAFLVFDSTELGFDSPVGGTRYWLLDANGDFADGINPRGGRADETGFSFGLFPDGDNDGFVFEAPTPGAPNSIDLPTSVVVSEIYFHPPYVPPSEGCDLDCSDALQWIELHNATDSDVDLTGWDITKGIRFAIEPGTTIAANGYLVIASSRDAFLGAHPGVAPAIVLGDWSRDLSHGSDTINLRDDLDNLVDHVKYGDGAPRNDEEPEDDVDDRTFRGTEWPIDADGSGRTLELVHPALDNRLGGAGRAS